MKLFVSCSVYLLITFCTTDECFADITVCEIFQQSHDKLKKSEFGTYNLDYKRKNLFSSDTANFSGFINFFSNSDSTFRYFYFKLINYHTFIKFDSAYYQTNEKSLEYNTSSNFLYKSWMHCFHDLVNFKHILKYCSDSSYTVKLIGTVKVEGAECFKLLVTMDSSQEVTGNILFYINKTSFIISKIEYTFYFQKEAQYECVLIKNLNLKGKKCSTYSKYYKSKIDSIENNYTYVERKTEKNNIKPLNVANRAPNFSLRNDSDSLITLYNLKDSIIILDFWYISCYPCLKTSPVLNYITDKYRNVKVLALNPYDEKNKIIQHKIKYKMNYETLVGTKNLITDYHVTAFPTIYILNSKYEIVKVIEGYNDNLKSEIEKFIIQASK